MTLLFSYIAMWINFKISYKDTYMKRAPLAINRAPLTIDLLLHHWFYVLGMDPVEVV